MKTLIWQMILINLGGSLLAAQYVVMPPATGLAQQAQAVQIYEQQVAHQQERVDAVTAQLKAIDEQAERRIQQVLEYVAGVTDSKESRTKVTTIKQTLFDGVRRQIDFYGRERGQRFTALYRSAPWVTKTALAADVQWLQGRVEKRVEQALFLVATLPAKKDVAKYQEYWDDGDIYRRTNPAYTHQQRVLSGGSSLRDKAAADLKTSIDRLARSRAELDRALAAAKTAEGREFIQGLIKQNTELVAKRREQIQQAVMKVNPGSRALGKEAADALVSMIEQERINHQRDNNEWIRLKNERDLERERLHLSLVRLENARRLLPAQ